MGAAQQKQRNGAQDHRRRREGQLVRRHGGEAAHGPHLDGGQLPLRVGHHLQGHEPRLRQGGDDDPRQEIAAGALQPGRSHQQEHQGQGGHPHEEGAPHDLQPGPGPQHDGAGRPQGGPRGHPGQVGGGQRIAEHRLVHAPRQPQGPARQQPHAHPGEPQLPEHLGLQGPSIPPVRMEPI